MSLQSLGIDPSSTEPIDMLRLVLANIGDVHRREIDANDLAIKALSFAVTLCDLAKGGGSAAADFARRTEPDIRAAIDTMRHKAVLARADEELTNKLRAFFNA